jgi:hypothetical protein
MAGVNDPGYNKFAFARQCAKMRGLRELRQKSCCKRRMNLSFPAAANL